VPFNIGTGTVDQGTPVQPGGPGEMVLTPLGPMDGACVHGVPNGAHIHQDGTVTLDDGSVFAQYQSCAPLGGAPTSKRGPLDAGTDQTSWVQGSLTNPDGLIEYSIVDSLPAAPYPGYNTLNYFIWQGIELANGDYLQPLINYVTNDYQGKCPNGEYCYQINPYFYGNNMHLVSATEPAFVNPGDYVEFYTYAISSTEWIFGAYDENSGARVYAYADETWPVGASTVYSSAVEWNGTLSCSELPESLAQVFFNIQVYSGTTGSSGWDAFNGATPSWSDHYGWNLGSGVPNCGYGEGQNPSAVYITW
jgi:hypothetical protein